MSFRATTHAALKRQFDKDCEGMGLSILKAASHTKDDGSSHAGGYEVFRKNVADTKEVCQLWLGKAPAEGDANTLQNIADYASASGDTAADTERKEKSNQEALEKKLQEMK
eukprot:3695139-Alexandrium_andersonii.AAC.1